MPRKVLTRDQAIERCRTANPLLEFGMFHYEGYDSETIFKCSACKTRFRQRIENVWRGSKSPCGCVACKTETKNGENHEKR